MQMNEALAVLTIQTVALGKTITLDLFLVHEALVLGTCLRIARCVIDGIQIFIQRLVCLKLGTMCERGTCCLLVQRLKVLLFLLIERTLFLFLLFLILLFLRFLFLKTLNLPLPFRLIFTPLFFILLPLLLVFLLLGIPRFPARLKFGIIFLPCKTVTGIPRILLFTTLGCLLIKIIEELFAEIRAALGVILVGHDVILLRKGGCVLAMST